MSDETPEQIEPADMTDDQIRTEIASIDQLAKQNSFKYEKRQRGDFPDSKWERFVTSQNEMFARREELEEELKKREAAGGNEV